ncbi:DUF6980 family protein [Candidatus Trichorickettsia mobilis]|uniref:DUF6980 family protein n=1 Tax=Candidatus Trichorickettsia mobilis TaxID=1346319 RepID=UPI00292FE8FD|nr:hypothetical protein [Candidatus Trichorickettsia mobilis]
MGFNELKTNYCCDELQFHIKERERIIIYIPITRSYLIKVSDHVGQEIKFCPWCGNKLPKDLTTIRASIIFDELHLDDYDDQRLPSEFKTDEWWKKRGL